jgi:hypothetical protein
MEATKEEGAGAVGGGVDFLDSLAASFSASPRE